MAGCRDASEHYNLRSTFANLYRAERITVAYGRESNRWKAVRSIRSATNRKRDGSFREEVL